MSKMPPQPEAMKRSGRPAIETFDDQEYLYRRVPTAIWPSADVPLTVDAVKLPDISMARSALGHPEWLRLDTHAGIFRKNWGVIGLQCVRIRPAFQPADGPPFTYRIVHVPLDDDYPHSEVQAFEGEKHLNTKESVLPEELHLEWRATLLEVHEVMIRPHEQLSIRSAPPTSHVPEPHPDRKD